MKIKTILVIGLGRIGLPQALLLANSGYTVYGLDHNQENKNCFSEQKTPFFEPEMDQAFLNSYQKTFFPYSNVKELEEHIDKIDVIIFTIGTQVFHEEDLNSGKEIDLTKYYQLLDSIFAHVDKFKKGFRIIIRTTMPLGGTDSLKKYIEEKFSLLEGKDFYMAFVPERITEAHAFEEFEKLPVIVGVYSDAAFDSIASLYQNKDRKIIKVSSPKTAEFCKLTDNSFRNTLFAYANEIAMHANTEGVNVNEVIDSVNDSYGRNHIPKPGFVSGYCLSKDPYIFELDFLKNKPNRDFHSLWYFGRKTNDFLIRSVVEKVSAKINQINNPRVAIVGLSFNKDVDDFRVSHSVTIIEMMIEKGVRSFNIYDPNVNKNKYTQIPDHIKKYVNFSTDTITPSLFDQVDAIIVCNQHKKIDEQNDSMKLRKLFQAVNKNCYLFDGWYAWSNAAHLDNVEYESIGFRNE